MYREAGADSRGGERTKRRKVAMACDQCRLKKMKCDGARPVCGTCARHRSRKYKDCTWSPLEFHGDPQPSSVSASPLEKRERVEFSTVSPFQTCMSGQSEVGLQRHGVSDRARESANSMIGLSPSDAHSEAFYGSSSAGSFINQLRKAVGTNRTATNDSLSSNENRPFTFEPAVQNLNQPISEFTLPTRGRADQLLRIFWQVVYPLYPFVDRRETIQQYSLLLTGKTENHPMSYCLLNVIFALACQLDAPSEPQSREKLSRVYFHRAKQFLDPWAIGTFQSVQVYLLLSLYFQSTNEPHHCWTMVGVAVRSAESLGLHLPVVSEHAASPSKRELCRKIWHGCVLMDRITSITFGRPPIISSAFASGVPRPLSIDEERILQEEYAQSGSTKKPSVMEFFNRLLDLFDIMYDLLATPNFTSIGADFGDNEPAEKLLDCLCMNDSFQILDIERKLIHWEKSLPTQLDLSSVADHDPKQQIFACQAVAIHQRYLHLRLIALRPALSAYVFAETRQLDTSVAFGGVLLQKVLLQCAVVCVSVAQEAISLAGDRRTSTPSSIDSVSEWWSNVLFLYSAAIVLIAAKTCPSILAEISQQSIDRSWATALRILEYYREFHPAVAQVLTAAKLLHGALSKHHQQAQGLTLDSMQNRGTRTPMIMADPPSEQPQLPIAESLDLIVDSPVEGSSMPLGFASGEFEFDFDFTNNDLTWLHTAPFEL